MSTFTTLFLCIQACILQNAYSQCLSPAGFGYGPGLAPIAPAIATAAYAAGAYVPGAYGPALATMELGPPGPFSLAPAAIEIDGYGGAGVGDMAVAGEIPVGGTTLVAGQVPILGAVRFAGELPATGTVTIAGSCGCGCGSPTFIY